jgi:hypothetical protein
LIFSERFFVSSTMVRVDDLPRELAAGVAGVLLEEVLGHALAGLVGAEEADGVDVGLEPPQQIDRLRGEAVALGLGEVEALAVPDGERLDEADEPDDEHDGDGGLQSVAQRARPERAARVGQPRQRRQHHEHDAGGHQRPPEAAVVAQARHELLDHGRAQADEPDVERPVGQPLHRPSPSTGMGAPKWPPYPPTFGAPRLRRGAPLSRSYS